MIAAARAATEEVLTSRVVDQMKSADIADIVDSAARGAARDIVTQTVSAHAATPGKTTGRDTEDTPQQVMPAEVVPVAGARRLARDGRKPEPVNDPKA